MKKLILVAILALFAAVPVSAQTYLTNTTLTTALTASPTDNVVVVGSATNVVAGSYLYIDHELMQVRSVSGLRATVLRGTTPASVKVAAHAAAAVVYVATNAQAVSTMLPAAAAVRAGACTLAANQFLPIFNVETGDMYACRYATSGSATRTWAKTNVQGLNGAGSLPTAWP